MLAASQNPPCSVASRSRAMEEALAEPVKTRSNRTVRAIVPFSPDVRFPTRTRVKKTSRTEANTCKKCGLSVRGVDTLLCAACLRSSLDVGQKEKPNDPDFEERKRQYLDEAKAFAAGLAKAFDDPSAERLYCPVFRPTKGPCACIQKHLSGDDADQKARSLLQLLREAKRLSQQKCYDWDEVKRVGRGHAVGLGNGQKHSEAFEQFVSEHRPRLREMQLCERASQKVLFYSNNFLHRCLKTEPSRGRRVERSRGKAALGRLASLESLSGARCCGQRCSGLCGRFPALVGQWRERAQLGQSEARRVLAEMLTPCGANATNCYRFISWVTGCSFTTIAKVSRQMLSTGGDREPPPHGLKKFWDTKNSSPAGTQGQDGP